MRYHSILSSAVFAALTFCSFAHANEAVRPIKVMQTSVRKDSAHILVYTTDDRPRLRMVLSCAFGTVGCLVPVAGDAGLYLPANDDAIYKGPNACIDYDAPKHGTGCYSVQDSSLE
jgi:hypothetical protein